MISLTVYGLPAPQGSKVFKGLSNAGRAILVESSGRVRPWRLAVKDAAVAARNGAPPLDGPLCVSMTFTMPKPLSAPRRRRTWPSRMPDLSKLVRSTEDALTDAGVWIDDARVVECTAAKVYPGEGAQALDAPGARIEIRQLTGAAPPSPLVPT